MLSINLILFYLITISYDIDIIADFFDEFSIIYFFMIITTFITLFTGFDYFYKNHKSIKMIILKRE